MKVTVIGSKGQLGTDVLRVLGEAGHEVIPLSHSEIEVTDPGRVRDTLQHHRPEIVINCAAYVQVDHAEEDSEAAFRVNALGAFYVAQTCAGLNALCIYISTDYVFDGKKTNPYTEEDTPCPINVYGTSKLAGEYLVRQACPESCIVRVTSLFGKTGATGKGGNFIETILAKARAGERLRVVNDIYISPTYTRDAAMAIVRFIDRRAPGIVHVANSTLDLCTWYLFARKATELCGLDVLIEPVSSDAYPTRARRPRNSALDGTRAANLLGRPLPAWEDALKRYLEEKGYLG